MVHILLLTLEAVLDYFLIVVVTPSGNILYNIAFGSLGVPNITMNIDELTTAQAVYAFQQAGGTMTSSGNGIPLGSISNYLQLYNDLPKPPSNTYTIGFSHTSVSSNLSSTADSEIETLADALASCVQSTSYCSSVKGNLPNYTSGDGMFIYILIGNYTNASMQTALNNLLSAISSLGIPWSSPAPIGSSSTTTTNNATTYTYTVGSYPDAIAIDGSGNVWIANYGSDNVTELSSTGAFMGTYSVGSAPDAIVIDNYGNIWVANEGSASVTELKSTGVVIGTYTVGTSPDAIAISSNGNVWVANLESSNVTELNGSNGDSIGTYEAGPYPDGIAIDSNGNIWVTNDLNETTTELNGATGSTINTYYNSESFSPDAIAIDSNGNVWVTNGINGIGGGEGNIIELNGSTGKLINTFSAGNLPHAIAIDSSGNLWIANYGDGTIGNAAGDSNVMELNSSGQIIGTYLVGSYPDGIAIDGSGNVWVANYGSNSVTELVGVATGVKTPLVLQPK